MNEAAPRCQTATEPATQLECSRLCVEGIDHERPAADESCRRHTSLRSMFNEARRGSTSGPADISRELTKEEAEARYGIGGWPVRIDRAARHSTDQPNWKRSDPRQHWRRSALPFASRQQLTATALRNRDMRALPLGAQYRGELAERCRACVRLPRIGRSHRAATAAKRLR